MRFPNINQSALTIFWYFANVILRANLGYGIITIGPAKINRSELTVIIYERAYKYKMVFAVVSFYCLI